MPHFVIEYARKLETTLDIGAVMQAAFDAGAGSGIMNAADIKVRALLYDHARFEGGIDTFLHVTVSMLEGRSDLQKEGLALCLREALVARFPQVGSISIDIRDMNATAYKKRLI